MLLNIIEYFSCYKEPIIIFLKIELDEYIYKSHLFYTIVVFSKTSFEENIFTDISLKSMCWGDAVVYACSPRIQNTSIKELWVARQTKSHSGSRQAWAIEQDPASKIRKKIQLKLSQEWRRWTRDTTSGQIIGIDSYWEERQLLLMTLDPHRLTISE